MAGLSLIFATPWVLLALATLPLIWWLLRLTPPKPVQEPFPPVRILEQLQKLEETPAHTPWWLILLRLLMATLVILAMAGPVWNPEEPATKGTGPILLIIDNSWAAGPAWEKLQDTAKQITAEAASSDRTISLIFAVGGKQSNLFGASAKQAEKGLQAARVQPVPANWQEAATAVEQLPQAARPTSIVWLSAGLKQAASGKMASALGRLEAEDYAIYTPSLDKFALILDLKNNPASLDITLGRPVSDADNKGLARAFDAKGRPVASAPYVFDTGKSTTVARFKLPVELRNDFARIELSGRASAGDVYLLDDRFRRRRVGLVTGEKSDLAQPLLSPLYYISRALGPYSEIRYPFEANVVNAVAELIESRVSALVFADIGTFPEEVEAPLAEWIDDGGMLIRFAGPRLAASSSDELVPVPLRRGDRDLGGSLSWATPQPLTSFNATGPFAGLPVPGDVSVKRQVLAEPGPDLLQHTWASLADGTPLVTATQRGKGWVVLFHVTASASWSNLALSGAFVEMLRRTVSLSSSRNLAINAKADGQTKTILQPYRILDGKGQLTASPQKAKPLTISAGSKPPVIQDNPPGLYGTADGFVALNLADNDLQLAPLDITNMAGTPRQENYLRSEATDLKPLLLALALVLLALDCLAVLWMAGALARGLARPAGAVIMIALLVTSHADNLRAQEAGAMPRHIEAALTTRLAYVITGIEEVDTISRQGLIGLTGFIKTRTSLEPGPPVGVDIAVDELNFFPLLYWPIDVAAPLPDAKTMARIDAFMKKGGSVVFDTKDALSGGFGGVIVSDATLRLQQILADLDIPPLERVPADHVLTKAFYLLNVFPGRYNSGDFWVEVSEAQTGERRPVRVGDGVSSIIITSNDLAGAWAVDSQKRPLMPTVPPSPLQRTYAYRVGVNLAMYTLTGNYKSDQVHIPALLERLGQ